MPESQIRKECLKAGARDSRIRGSKGSSERLKPVSKEKVQGFEGAIREKVKNPRKDILMSQEIFQTGSGVYS
jgi:hypothetical protein